MTDYPAQLPTVPNAPPDQGPPVVPRFDWRHQYDIFRDKQESEKVQIDCSGDPGRTIQSFTNDADINTLIKRFGISDGAIPPAVTDPRYFGDFSNVPDFRRAIEETRTAQERFDALPADLRSRFGNDPVQLWEFVTDERNSQESIRLGLLKQTTVQVPITETPPVSPST